MASTSISAVTTLITGATSDSGSIVASADTCTITGPSGGPLDFDTLVLRVTNDSAAGSAQTTIAVSSSYSSLDAGTATIGLPTGETVYIGGADFESARFKQVSAQSIILSFVGDGTSCVSTIEAIQAPYSHTG